MCVCLSDTGLGIQKRKSHVFFNKQLTKFSQYWFLCTLQYEHS